MRRILWLTVAGVASAVASGFGVAAWHAAGVSASPSLPLRFFCVFPALSFVAFCLYFRWPRFALIASLLLLTGAFITAYFVNLSACLTRACSTADSIRMGWQTITQGRALWALAIAAVCLLFDHTGPASHAKAPAARENSDQDLRT